MQFLSSGSCDFNCKFVSIHQFNWRTALITSKDWASSSYSEWSCSCSKSQYTNWAWFGQGFKVHFWTRRFWVLCLNSNSCLRTKYKNYQYLKIHCVNIQAFPPYLWYFASFSEHLLRAKWHKHAPFPWVIFRILFHSGKRYKT